jgi:hypothetical protein
MQAMGVVNREFTTTLLTSPHGACTMMTTTAETAATDTILAIDLGKYKSVAYLWPMCLVPPRAVRLRSKVAGAADAKESTTIRDTHETEGRILQHSTVRLLTLEASNVFGSGPEATYSAPP